MNKDRNCVNINQSASVEHCENVSVEPITNPESPITIRVPVTLAELRISTSLAANIRFPDPVLEIKDIKKRVKIVQCRLLLGPTTGVNGPFERRNTQLFLRGFVRKNIQYATPCPDSKGSCVSSEIRSLTTDIPFECVTTIDANDFIVAPQLPLANSRSEFDFFRAQELGHGFPEKDHLLSSDLSQFHQVSQQFYNQLPFCELLDSNIVEWDEAVDRTPLPGHAPFEEGTFQNIVEKMFLEFTIKVLQNQQIEIGVPAPTGPINFG